jgi:hypothetical protein
VAAAGEAPAKPQAAGEQPASATTPEGEATLDPEAQATATAVAGACKKMIDAFAREPGALKALPKDQQAWLVQAPMARDAVTCLAVAANNPRYCDLLSGEDKQGCARGKLFKDIKGLPKEQVKGAVLYKLCVADAPNSPACEKLRSALTANDAAKCEQLPGPLIDYCKAITKRDPAECKNLSKAEERGRCEAYATDDEKRCPADSVDCRKMTVAFAATKKDGIAGFAGSDSTIAAAVWGKDACKRYLTDLEQFCSKRF